MIRRPPRSTHCISSAASDVYKRQVSTQSTWETTSDKYAIRNLSTGKYLEVKGGSIVSGADIIQNTKTGQDQQLWKLETIVQLQVFDNMIYVYCKNSQAELAAQVWLRENCPGLLHLIKITKNTLPEEWNLGQSFKQVEKLAVVFIQKNYNEK
eukprot:TRINITY_DN12689_c0_g1_i1.p3 TRINITY_DN12689_c0_g1~~TRINITY_DN12689_c0_g1_i1.p3  ORF type:complete len:153 (-),score=44.96 TRINITY_DN12689_c0_g1_i1:451-909(-)